MVSIKVAIFGFLQTQIMMHQFKVRALIVMYLRIFVQAKINVTDFGMQMHQHVYFLVTRAQQFVMLEVVLVIGILLINYVMFVQKPKQSVQYGKLTLLFLNIGLSI